MTKTARLFHVLACVAIWTNFAWFNRKILKAPFAPDDFMNLWFAWRDGWIKTFASAAMFYSNSYRPLGALYYLALYGAVGLHPVLYRVVDLIVLVVSLLLAYEVFRRVTGNYALAYLAAFLFSYLEKVSIWLNYDGAWVYDRLAFLFFIMAACCYVRWRAAEKPLSWRQVTGIALLYLLALDSKEMSVTLPIVLFAYDVLYHSWRSVLKNWPVMVVMGLMAAIYTYGKTHGVNSLMNFDAYRPRDFTVSHYLFSQAHYLDEMVCGLLPMDTKAVAAFFALTAVCAWAFRSRSMALALVWIMVTPLPIVFLERGGGCLVIPTAGWCLLLAEYTLRIPQAAARFLFRDNVYVRYTLQGGCVAVLLYYYVTMNVRFQGYDIRPMTQLGAMSRSMLEELRRVRPDLRANDHVYFVNSPFPGCDATFVTTLWANIDSLKIEDATQPHPHGKPMPADTTVILTMDAHNRLSVARREPEKKEPER